MSYSSPSSRKSRKAASLSNVYYSNAVYFPNRQIYNGHTPGSLNYSCISTVYYSFATVTADGSVLVNPPLDFKPLGDITLTLLMSS